MPDPNDFVRGRLHSFRYAFKGLLLLIRTEKNFQVHVLALAVVSVAGFVFEISNTEWCLQLLAAALVIVIEVANTALEKLCDYVQPEKEKRIGVIKDIAAAGVLWAALTALVIAGLIYIPRL